MEQDDIRQPRLYRDGHFWATDEATYDALKAVKKIEPRASTELFYRWRDEGQHIRPDHAADRRNGIAPAETMKVSREPAFAQDAAPPQGHRR